MTGKLDQLIEIEGYDDVVDLFATVLSDSVSPGICINPGCDCTTEVEPDQDRGYCESCRTQTVQSALILAGLI
jgi:hypothetical protein